MKFVMNGAGTTSSCADFPHGPVLQLRREKLVVVPYFVSVLFSFILARMHLLAVLSFLRPN
jgi:hypothetical protein